MILIEFRYDIKQTSKLISNITITEHNVDYKFCFYQQKILFYFVRTIWFFLIFNTNFDSIIFLIRSFHIFEFDCMNHSINGNHGKIFIAYYSIQLIYCSIDKQCQLIIMDLIFNIAHDTNINLCLMMCLLIWIGDSMVMSSWFITMNILLLGWSIEKAMRKSHHHHHHHQHQHQHQHEHQLYCAQRTTPIEEFVSVKPSSKSHWKIAIHKKMLMLKTCASRLCLKTNWYDAVSGCHELNTTILYDEMNECRNRLKIGE